MKVQGNLIIFSTDNEERKDVRRLKEKKLQLLLSNDNTFSSAESVTPSVINSMLSRFLMISSLIISDIILVLPDLISSLSLLEYNLKLLIL